MRKILATALALIVSMGLSAQSRTPLTLTFAPGMLLPFGPLDNIGTGIYSLGGLGSLDFDVAVPGVKFLDARGSLNYTFAPTVLDVGSLNLVSVSAGPVLRLDFHPRFALKLAAFGGYSALMREGSDMVGNPLFGGELGATIMLSRNFGLSPSASYRYTLYGVDGFAFNLGVTIPIGGGPAKIKFIPIDIRMDPVFPVFYKYYDVNPAGTIVFQNGESGTVKGVKVSFLVPQYMAGPKECASFAELKAGEKREVPVYALFTDAIIGVTEDTKVNAKIVVEYSYMDAAVKGETDLSIRVLNRNAMSWDDDRKAAAFVTAKDPELLKFAKGVASRAREKGSAVNSGFRSAMGLFQAFGAYGIRYVSDPASSYAEKSKSDTAVDFLQFPSQTLSYKAGDCDDLSILYCAMNEAVGTETAFITAPGHIFAAFNSGIPAADVRGAFSRPDDFILRDGKAWVPVEITQISQGFLSAWRTGAKEWREAEAAGSAGFYPIHDAWKTYEPAAFLAGTQGLKDIDAAVLDKSYMDELSRFIQTEIKDREANIKKELSANPQDAKARNKLGVLYARYGLNDEASAEFNKASKTGYAAAFANLGNVALVMGKTDDAIARFKEAYDRDPGNQAALAGLAKAYSLKGDDESMKKFYDKLKNIDPKTAERFASLASLKEGGTRAAEAVIEDAIWSE
jgi:hypothetical protein